MEEIAKLLSRIFLMLFILCFLTLMWMNLKDSYAFAKEVNERQFLFTDESLYIDDLEVMSDKEALNMNGYVFQVDNDNTESNNFKIKIVNDYYKKFDYEKTDYFYIKYQVRKNNEEFSEIKYLDETGIIYTGKLTNMESADFEIKLWVDESYTGNVNYYANVLFYFE